MSTTATKTKSPKKPERPNTYPLRTPRFWHGMRVRGALRLLANNRFHVHPARWGMIFTVLFCAVINSILYRLQLLRHGRKIEKTEITQPPIFIVGHWRSGTTHLHELLVRDERFAFPTTYECFAPHHFVISEWLIPRALWFLIPSKRPMDNMLIGFDRPQEDDIALCALGAPTPYFRMAFPNHPPPYSEFLNMDGVNDEDLDHFKRAMKYLVKSLTYFKKKQIVLKSPPHTGRIGVLAEIFPGAKFIHIVRDPYALFPSTKRTWQTLDFSQAFQRPEHKDLDEYILDSLVRMYDGFDRQLPSVDEGHLYQLRYEDLVRDPLGERRQLYEKLDLGDFENIREQLEQYLQTQKDYQPNRHDLDPEIKAQIDTRWRGYIERYGYGEGDAASAAE